MILFKENKGELVSVKQKGFKIEKELQGLIEKNLNTIFGIQLIQSEFTFKNRRFDTLCFDEESKSFVIIEYKNKENTSVIDQGFSYLSLLLNNKSDFLLRLSHHYDKVMKSDDVDWSSSKVIFISPKFNPNQKESVNFNDIPFELWEVKQFEGGLVGLTRLYSDSSESISSNIDIGGENNVIKQVTREVKVYTENYHLYEKSKNRNEWVVDLYFKLKGRILEFDDVVMKVFGTFISFRTTKTFVDIVVYQKGLYLIINMPKGKLNDPENLTQTYDGKGHWGSGDYYVLVDQKTDLDYIMFLIRQSYKESM
jgi:predicted transport protein